MDRFKWQFGRKGVVVENRSFMKYEILLTDNCNLSCSYCYQRYKNNGKVISRDTLIKTLDRLFLDAIPNQNRQDVKLIFCGGEALTQPDLIDLAMTYIGEKYLPALDRKIRISVLTNGTLLASPEVQKVLLKHPRMDVSVSFDGIEEVQNASRGEFDLVSKNIKEITRVRGKKPMVLMTVAPDAAKHLVDSFKYIVSELGIDEVWMNVVVDDLRWIEDDEYANRLYQGLCGIADFMTLPGNEEIWCNAFDPTHLAPVSANTPICGAIGGQMVFTPEGELFLCYTCRNPQVIEKVDYRIGDIHNWIDGEKYAEVRTCTLGATKGLEDCVSCDIGSGCRRCFSWFAGLYGNMREGNTAFCKVHHAKYWAFQYLFRKRSERVCMNSGAGTSSAQAARS